jgi:hypothetical protein
VLIKAAALHATYNVAIIPNIFAQIFLAILRRYFRVRTMLNLRKSLFAHREQLKRECVISININDCRVK